MKTEKWNNVDAIKLEYGQTYVIEIDHILMQKQKERLREQLRRQTSHLNVDFIILDGGMKIAKIRSKDV